MQFCIVNSDEKFLLDVHRKRNTRKLKPRWSPSFAHRWKFNTYSEAEKMANRLIVEDAKVVPV